MSISLPAVQEQHFIHGIHTSFCCIVVGNYFWQLFWWCLNFWRIVHSTHKYGALVFRPTYETSVVSWVNANFDSYNGTFLHSNNLSGMLRLFLRMAPTMVKLCVRSIWPSSFDVKKLTIVMLCPFKPSFKSSTTRWPWFFSTAAPAARPNYGCIFHT